MHNPATLLRLLTLAAALLAVPAARDVSAIIPKERTDTPRVSLIDPRALAETRRRIRSGDKTFDAPLRKLEDDARKALTAGPFSVTTKAVAPPSGDRHDYMSQAPYFWPDPERPNGLPYVRRDGERNPEINRITDHREMDRMVEAVSALALAYYLKGDEAYAAKAAVLLRAWFLEPSTRMNPNLEYAQFIPGVNTGRGIGLIETRGLTRVADAVGLLAGAKVWSGQDQRGVEDWYDKFLHWMLESRNGRDEAKAVNNHGTYYDVQVASYALFLGKRELAKRVLEEARAKRVAVQIEPDGRQPLELARTRAWGYSVGNLDGLVTLAELGDRVGVDLWQYRTPDGRGIRRALEYLYPFAVGEAKWPHQQLGEWPPEMLFPVMRRAAARYTDAQFDALVRRIPAADPSSRELLSNPARRVDVSRSGVGKH
ncbi:MAG: alginate lyase family protein [Pyrinomonadaceae bacterium]